MIPSHLPSLTGLIPLTRRGHPTGEVFWRGASFPRFYPVGVGGSDDLEDTYAAGAGAFRIEAGKDTQEKIEQSTVALNTVATVGSGLFGLVLGLAVGFLIGRSTK